MSRKKKTKKKYRGFWVFVRIQAVMLLLVLGDVLGAVRAQRDLTAPTAFGSAALCALVLLNGVSIYAAL